MADGGADGNAMVTFCFTRLRCCTISPFTFGSTYESFLSPRFLLDTRPNFRNRFGGMGRETFQEKAFGCLSKLFERVPAKRRNFILDVKSCTYELTQRSV